MSQGNFTLSQSDVKQKIDALVDTATPLQTKVSDIEILINMCVKNLDFAGVVKENNGVIVITTLFKNANDIDLKAKASTLLFYLSVGGQRGAPTESLMMDVNVLSLVNLFSEKDFRVLMQVFDGLKILGDKNESVSLGLSAATLFLENITNLIAPSSKGLSDFQKIEILSNFTQFALSGAISKAADEAGKNSSSTLSKNFSLAYEKFTKTLESCHTGKYTPLDMSVVPIIQLVKEGKLIAGLQSSSGNPFLDIINQWLGGSKKFNLLYQATKDGFTGNSFHAKCNNKSPTVSIITSSDGYVFGGYAAVAWTSGGYVTDSSNQSFIFSLKNPSGGQPARNYLTPASNTMAIHGHSGTHGPSFGGGHDIICYNNSNSNNSSYFNCPHTYKENGNLNTNTFTGSNQFTTKEIEVYQVL